MEYNANLDINYKAIGRRLKTARLSKGLKKDNVADILDTTQSYISGIETGANKPGLPTLIKLCRIYGVSFDYILFENLHENIPLKQSFNPDFDEVLADCNEKELQFLLLLMRSAKETARRELEY